MSPRITSLLLLAWLSGCADRLETPTAPDRSHLMANPDAVEAMVELCHPAGPVATVITVSTASLPDHLGQGDYISRYEVDRASARLGDGIHFARIGDAIAAAKAVRVARNEVAQGLCRITIAVAGGVFHGSTAPGSDPAGEQFPLVIDFPDVTIQGGLEMQLDERGRALGYGESGETVLNPSPALVSTSSGGPTTLYSEPLLVVASHPGGFRADRVTVEGLVFQSGWGIGQGFGGVALLSLRANGLVIRGNRFDPNFRSSIDLRSGNALVERNFLGGDDGSSCDICLAGPGSYHAEGNRVLSGGTPGFLILPAVLLAVPSGVEQDVLPAHSRVEANVINNEVRDHRKLPVGVGIRVGAIGVGAPNVEGEAVVEARNNTLRNNTFGLIVEGSFPVANTLLKGDISLTLRNNELLQSCQNDLLVSLGRSNATLGLTNQPYLRNSTFRLDLGGNLDWQDAWYGHPADLGNQLIVDGVAVPNGVYAAYDPNKVCP